MSQTVDRDHVARAQKALAAFRTMQPGLTSYARAVTGEPAVRIQVTAGFPHTDGTTIFYRPPLSLADDTKHDRSVCDKRDDVTLQQLCPACRVREDILSGIYHEIAHIAYHSFAPFTDKDRAKALSAAVAFKGDDFVAKMNRRMEKYQGKQGGDSFILLANSISEYLGQIMNILEDVRIDERMFLARKGTRKMREVRARRAFTEGVEQADGSVARWIDAPLNAQLIVALYAVASRWEVNDFFAPEVVAACYDSELTATAEGAKTARSVSDVFNLSFDALMRGKELGFFAEADDITEDDEPQPEPQDQESEDKQDRTEPDKESDSQDNDESSEESSDQEQGDTEDEADDDQGAGKGEDTGEVAGDSGSSDHSDLSDAQSDDAEDSPETEEAFPENDTPSDASNVDSGAGETDEQPDTDDDGSPSGSGDSTGVPEDDSESGDDQPDNGGSSPNPEGAGESVPGDTAEANRGVTSDATEEDSSTEESAAEVDPEGIEDESGGSGTGETDSSEEEGGLDDEDSRSSGDDSQEFQTESGYGDPREPDGSGGDTDTDSGLATDEAPEDQGAVGGEDSLEADRSDDADPASETRSNELGTDKPNDMEDSSSDTGSDPWGQELEAEIDYGSADSVPQYVEAVTGHHGDHHAEESAEYSLGESVDDGTAEAAMEVAIEQGLYFDTAPVNIVGVNVHRYTDVPDSDNAWRGTNGDKVLYSEKSLRNIGLRGDFEPDESLLGEALQVTRRVFDDNKRARHQKNLKSGKIRGGSLAKRAPFNDPRMFKKTILPGKKSYAVVIGVDISASMSFTGARNMKLAKRAVTAQAELCSRVGIDFAVYAHSALDSGDGTYENLSMEIYEIKSFQDQWDDRARESLKNIGPLQANVDGHTLEYYRKAVERTPATDKIILYYTDGAMPAANYDEELEVLQTQIAKCRQQNITLMGVGIRTSSPEEFGMDTVRVDGDEDLVKVIHHLEKKLTDR